jgi:hypothetical protein
MIPGSLPLAIDEPRTDSCGCRRDSCPGQLANAGGGVGKYRATDILQPIVYSDHRIGLATAYSDEIADDSRLTALHHVPWHIHRIAVTHSNPPFIADELATVVATNHRASDLVSISGRRTSPLNSLAAAQACYKLRASSSP